MKKYIVMFIVILIIIGFGIKFVFDLSKEKEMTQEVVLEIRNNYKELGSNISEYNKYRKLIGTSLSNYYQESFSLNYNDIINKFKEYDRIVVSIKNNVEKIDDNCGDRIFADSDINNICNGYKITYEEVSNVYLNDINNFNRFVDTYNEEMRGNLSLFKSSVIDNYIDYNNDGKYKGMEENEEN